MGISLIYSLVTVFLILSIFNHSYITAIHHKNWFYLSLSIIRRRPVTVLCWTSGDSERCFRKSCRPMSHNDRILEFCFTYVLSSHKAISRIINIWSQWSCQHLSTRDRNTTKSWLCPTKDCSAADMCTSHSFSIRW
jgi:hypothetical protein